MKKYVSLFIILMLCVSSFVFAEEFKTYKSPLFNFTISYPQNWETKQISGIVAFLSPLENKEDKFRENVNVVVEDISGKQLSSEQYAKAADDAWLKYDIKLRVVDFQKTNLNGKDAFYTIAENDKLKYKQYKFVKNNTAYILTYTSAPDKFSKFLNTADTIIKSFEIK